MTAARCPKETGLRPLAVAGWAVLVDERVFGPFEDRLSTRILEGKYNG